MIVNAMLPSIITGQELVQNHRFITLPDRLADAIVPQHLVSKKGAKRLLGAVLTFNSPLQL
jgi:hypothetical protein